MKGHETEPTGRWGDLVGDVNRARAARVDGAKRLRRSMRLVRHIALIVAVLCIGATVLSLRMHNSVLAVLAGSIAALAVIGWAYVIPAIEEPLNREIEEFRAI